MKKNSLYKKLLLIICFSSLVLSCTNTTEVKHKNTQELAERITLRWQALIKKDWDTAYQFQTSAYRQRQTPWQFQLKFGRKPSWKSFKIDAIALSEATDAAEAKVTIAYDYYTVEDEIIDSKTQATEHWIKQDNTWWIEN